MIILLILIIQGNYEKNIFDEFSKLTLLELLLLSPTNILSSWWKASWGKKTKTPLLAILFCNSITVITTNHNVHKLRVYPYMIHKWWINYSHWNYSSPPLPNLRAASHPLFSSDLFSGFLPHSSSDLSHISLYPPQVCQSLVPQPLSRIFSATPALPLTCGGQDWTKKCVLCYHISAGEKLSQHKTNKQTF